ncbi:MAG: lysylphosphatidylglycerol synthase transmembrane domain-containing protein [Acidimicrobiia bacterium]
MTDEPPDATGPELDVPRAVGAPLETERAWSWRRIVLRVVALLVTAVSFYYVGPRLLDVFATFPRLSTIGPLWLAVIVACETLSFVMVWLMLRIALHTKRWAPVVTSQLAGNSFSSIVPGGAAAGAALQMRMLSQSGIDTTTAVTGMTAFTLLQFASLSALPILSLPAVLGGTAIADGLVQAVIVGTIAFFVIMVVGFVLAAFDAPLTAVGRGVQRVLNVVRRHHAPLTDLPERVVIERNRLRRTLGNRWWEALLITVGRVLFDYLALLAALAAVGARPAPSLVLLAYASAVVLAMIPLSPGGLGFVEAGLAGMLTLAGVDGAQAVFATLVYRLAQFWLPLFAGPVAYLVFRHHQATAPAGDGRTPD